MWCQYEELYKRNFQINGTLLLPVFTQSFLYTQYKILIILLFCHVEYKLRCMIYGLYNLDISGEIIFLSNVYILAIRHLTANNYNNI